MRLASLKMYSGLPVIATAAQALWDAIRGRLSDRGFEGLPVQLDQALPYDEAWLHPDLLLSQTCGYPYVKRLLGRVRLVATPVYSLPGCDGASSGAFIVVGKHWPGRTLAHLRGTRAAINDRSSNSGANLLRALIAPLAEGGRFFASVSETGGHLASLYAVASGRSDVASIDCVTYGNVLRFDPSRLANVRILTETQKGPGLPFITRRDTSESDLDLLRQALDDVIADPRLADIRETLALVRFERLGDPDYRRLADLESAATQLGYPVIA